MSAQIRRPRPPLACSDHLEERAAIPADTVDPCNPEQVDSTRRPSRLRAWRFQIIVLAASVVAGALAAFVRTVAYIPIDVQIARAVQSIETPWLLLLFHWVGWIGFPPQSNLIFGSVILGLFLRGFRLEAVMTLFAAVGSAALWYWIAAFVDRPRPTPDLVNVAVQLPTGGFPSGHVLNLTAIFGFLTYLAIVRVSDSRWRVLLVAPLTVPIVTIGLARVYEGAHWPSDILGGYLIGGIWLALTIQIYRSARAWIAARRRPDEKRHATADRDETAPVSATAT